jgi:hypothetical protein
MFKIQKQETTRAYCSLFTGVLLGLLFNPKDAGDMLFQNAG